MKSRRVTNEKSLRKTAEKYGKKADAAYDKLEIDKALRYCEKAYEIYERLSDAKGMADVFDKIADVYSLRIGGDDYIEDLYRRAVAVCKKVNDTKSYVLVLSSVSNFYSNHGKEEKARKINDEILRMFNDIEDYDGMEDAFFQCFYTDFGSGKEREFIPVLNEFLEKARKVGNRLFEGVVYKSLGIVFYHGGEIDTALMYYEKAKNIFEEEGSNRNLAEVFGLIGRLFVRTGNEREAIDNYLEGLKAAEKPPAPVNHIAKASLYLGLSRIYMSDRDKAISYALDAARILKKFGGDLAMLHVYYVIGMAYENSQSHFPDYDAAISFFGKALKICERAGNRDTAITILLEIAFIYKSLGDFHRALATYKKIQNMLDESVDWRMKANVLMELGSMYMLMKSNEKSIEVFKAAYDIYEKNNDYFHMTECLSYLGSASYSRDDYSAALNYYEHVISLSEKIASKRFIAFANGNIGKIHANLGDKESAMKYYEKALDIFEKDGDKENIGWILGEIGLIHSEEDPEKAVEYYKKAYDIFSEIKRKEDMENMAVFIADIEYKIDNDEEKLMRTYRDAISSLIGDKMWSEAIRIMKLFGDRLIEMEKWKEALDVFKTRLEIAMNIGNKEAVNESKEYIEYIEGMA